MRFILANLMYDESVTFENIHNLIPDIYSISNDTLSKFKEPRILKSHECFNASYPKVVYLVRDPRAVAISYYYYHVKYKKIDKEYPLSRFVKKFIDGKLDDFGSWADNVGGWLKAGDMDNDKIVLIKYEDMIDNAQTEVAKVIKFFGWNKSQDQITRAVELSSFERMRESEQTHAHKDKYLKNSLKDVHFVRSGKKFEWKEKLDNELQNRIKKEWGCLMAKLGYSD